MALTLGEAVVGLGAASLALAGVSLLVVVGLAARGPSSCVAGRKVTSPNLASHHISTAPAKTRGKGKVVVEEGGQ